MLYLFTKQLNKFCYFTQDENQKTYKNKNKSQELNTKGNIQDYKWFCLEYFN